MLKTNYTIEDFSIVSTECDYDLFCNDSYKAAVELSINQLMSDYEENNDYIYSKEKEKAALNLICHKSTIEIRDRREEPTIYLWGILDYYKKAED